MFCCILYWSWLQMFTYIIIYACAQEVWLCSHLVWTNWVQPIALEVIEIWDSFSNLNRWSRSLGDLNMSTLYLVLQVSFCQVSKRDLENEKCLLHWRWFFLKSQSFISFSRWARSLVLFLPSFIERRPVILKRDPWYWKETRDIEIGGWDWMTLQMHSGVYVVCICLWNLVRRVICCGCACTSVSH